jgi:hypothetical protein
MKLCLRRKKNWKKLNKHIQMRLTKFIYTTLVLVSSATLAVQAQDVKTTDKKDEKTINEEIEVVRPYKPILAEAVKLRRSPDLNDVVDYKAKFNYSITDKKLELNSDINKLQAQQVAAERQEELINNYVKGGFGNATTTLLEAYINTGRDEALQAGGYFRHFGQEGKLTGQKFNQQELSVFGRSITDQATFSGRVNYQRNGLYFYGTDPAQPQFNLDPEKQGFNFIEAEGEVVNRYSADENALSYAAKINGYLWGDKFDARENAVTVNGYLNKRIQSFNLGLAAGLEFGSTKGVTTDVANNLLRLNPYIRLQASGVKINAGINFVQEFGDFSTSRIFPLVTADFTLIPDFLQIFGELKGDVNRNTMKMFTDENPFLNSDIQIQNTVEKFSLTAGIKGTGGPGFGYKVKAYHKKITDMPLYVNSFGAVNKFDVIYDFGNMKLTGINGEISVQISDALHWTGSVFLEQYKSASESNSWFKPQARATSNLLYNFNDKLSFNAAVYMQGESKGKLYTEQPAVPYIVPNPAIETVVDLKGFVDFGLGANYKINNQFGAFLKVNNLLNKDNSRYLYYNNIGASVFGGVSYSF